MHSQIQQERVKIIATVINKLLASQDNRKGNKSFDSTNLTDLTDLNIRRLKGKKYILVEDKMQKSFFTTGVGWSWKNSAFSG